MNERIFKRLLNSFLLDTKLKQSRNNNMVVLIQSTHPFRSGLSMKDALMQSEDIEGMRMWVNDSFCFFTKQVIQPGRHPNLEGCFYPPDLYKQFDEKKGLTWLEEYYAQDIRIESGVAFPLVNDEWSRIYDVWQTMTQGKVAHSYVVCTQWDSNEPNSAQSTIINIHDYVTKMMTSA